MQIAESLFGQREKQALSTVEKLMECLRDMLAALRRRRDELRLLQVDLEAPTPLVGQASFLTSFPACSIFSCDEC
jgi:hypothetical protein